MSIKLSRVIQLLVAAAGIVFISAAGAQSTLSVPQNFNGSMNVVVNPFASSTASYTSSSLALNGLNLVGGSVSGTFALVPTNSDFTASTTLLTGISSTPSAASVADYFQFSTPDSILGNPGTTPNNRFEFDLSTISSIAPNAFFGTGTLIDTQGDFANTPGEFTVSFSGPNNYSFTLAAVPEPSTIALIVTGSFGALMIRRRKA